MRVKLQSEHPLAHSHALSLPRLAHLHTDGWMSLLSILHVPRLNHAQHRLACFCLVVVCVTNFLNLLTSNEPSFKQENMFSLYSKNKPDLFTDLFTVCAYMCVHPCLAAFYISKHLHDRLILWTKHRAGSQKGPSPRCFRHQVALSL